MLRFVAGGLRKNNDIFLTVSLVIIGNCFEIGMKKKKPIIFGSFPNG